jgi:hypothetical protein
MLWQCSFVTLRTHVTHCVRGLREFVYAWEKALSQHLVDVGCAAEGHWPEDLKHDMSCTVRHAPNTLRFVSTRTGLSRADQQAVKAHMELWLLKTPATTNRDLWKRVDSRLHHEWSVYRL